MTQNIILTFSLLFGSCIALIAAVYVALDIRRRKKQILKAELQTE